MKKYLFLLLAITLFGMDAFTQDFIYTRNNNRIAAKIIDLEISEVHYKDYNNQDGPVIAIKTMKSALLLLKMVILNFFSRLRKL